MKSDTVCNGPVLVTGATGFVGRHVCEQLLSRGFSLRVAVRKLITMPEDWQPAVIGDIGPDTDWTNALKGVSCVVHMVSRLPGPRSTVDSDESDYQQINVGGSVGLARAALAAGVKRFIYLSTIKVNGESTTLDEPFTTVSELQPQDAYALSKLQAERELNAIAEDAGMEVVILRSPLVYGPGVRANFLALLRLVDRGLPMPLACVRNRRSMLYVKNLASAIEHCLHVPRIPRRTYLLSDGEDLSTPALIKRIAMHMDKPSRVLPFPVFLLNAAGVILGKRGVTDRLTKSLQVDSSPFRDECGWHPPFSLDDGLRETIAWYRQQAG